MIKEFQTSILSVLTAIVGVAVVAVIVSKKSATVDVIKAAGDAYSGALREAVRPITS